MLWPMNLSAGRPTLFVASTGGHLTQLIDLSERITEVERAVWVTFESDQARSALEGREVIYVPYLAPRGYASLLRNLPRAARVLRRQRPERVISTGSGIALAYLPLARIVGARAYYIESATRAAGPSRTGALLARVPGVRLRTQHPQWAEGKWRFAGSVFDGFQPVPGPPRPLHKVVVTVGTMETYGFRRLVQRLFDVLPAGVEVLWQTGVTDIAGIDIDAHRSVPATELEAAIAAADLVVAHAGTGTALTSLRLGHRPVLVARRGAHGEHVDDHQAQTASYLSGLDLVTVLEVDEIDIGALEAATAGSVTRSISPPRIELSG